MTGPPFLWWRAMDRSYSWERRQMILSGGNVSLRIVGAEPSFSIK